MIIVAMLTMLLYLFLSVFGVGIFGGLLAFILSRPGKIVSTKRLAFGVLVFVVVYDLVMFTIVAPLDLTLKTDNVLLIELLGSSDLSDIFQPSFGVIDIAFYAMDVAVGTYLGKFLVARYYKRHDLLKSELGASSS